MINLTLTAEEVRDLLKALNFVGGVMTDDDTYDNLYDKIDQQAGSQYTEEENN